MVARARVVTVKRSRAVLVVARRRARRASLVVRHALVFVLLEGGRHVEANKVVL